MTLEIAKSLYSEASYFRGKGVISEDSELRKYTANYFNIKVDKTDAGMLRVVAEEIFYTLAKEYMEK